MSESDPPRLTEPGSGAPDELRALFEAGKQDVASPAELASLAHRLGPVFELPGAQPSPAGAGATATAKLGVALALVIGGAAGVWSVLRDEPAMSGPAVPSASVALTEPPPSARSASPSAMPLEPLEAPAPSAADANASQSERSVRATSRTSAPSEAEVLERARRALASNPARALALTTEHKLRFPGGALAQEREVIAIEALGRLGRSDQASRRADEFAKSYPGSAHQHKLDAGTGR